MKKQILWLAPYIPYPKVRHAGGKNLNYYINYINDTGKFDITFIGLGYEEERKEVGLERLGISSDIYYRDHSKLDYIIRRVVSGFTLLNPWTKYARQLLLYEHMQLSKRIEKYKAAGGNPDIVMLHWTSMGLIMPEIKALFPKAKYIMIEEDVTYLGYQRKYETFGTNQWKRFYTTLKKAELEVIKEADLTVVLNEKDKDLLINDGIPKDKVFEGTNYFERHTGVKRNPDYKNLLFFGAMDRAENYDSVIWFINNVMDELANEGYTLTIVGANPAGVLKDKVKLFNEAYKKNGREVLSENSNITDKHQNKLQLPITLTGFVDSVDPYFERALCLVAPLLLGAGIKVKIQEALSAGVPVLTNDIGIEGIGAKDQEEFLFCKTPEDYINNIRKLSDDKGLTEKIGDNAFKYIQKHNDINDKLNDLLGTFLDGCNVSDHL
ncbi:glycosyltransferase [Butyrivibrio sp. MB2005]|uniref:glycosyltransferase n=1 Tax=Butyrivibrio sp. MB2005 TaxID=1280678 RepID=UPI0009DC0EB3|nr:glycosyltransferase [Butyrivibrio sp. MB2005]